MKIGYNGWPNLMKDGWQVLHCRVSFGVEGKHERFERMRR